MKTNHKDCGEIVFFINLETKKGITVPAGHEVRVEAYCRVSTTPEEQQSNLENQISYYSHLMQKTYAPYFLIGKQEKNNGELAMCLIENAHEPIIDRETFEQVQEINGRKNQNI